MGIIVKSSVRTTLALLLLILCGCVTPVSNTGYVLALDRKADIAYIENRCDEAITMYTQLAKQLPKNTKSLLRIGNCHARNLRQDDAIVAFKEALARDPYYNNAWYNLGLIQAQILAQTMAEMGRYIDPTDSSMDSMRTLSQTVLEAFSITIKPETQKVIGASQGLPAVTNKATADDLKNDKSATND